MTTKMSIKDLTNSLKNKSLTPTEEAPVRNIESPKAESKIKPKEETKDESKPNREKKERSKSKISTRLREEFEEANQNKDYSLKSIVHIDDDIHEVFTKLKSATKLNLGRFVSLKLQQVIEDNKEEIQDIIRKSKKSNKFLD